MKKRASDVGNISVFRVKELVVEPLVCTQRPVHLWLHHAAKGAFTQLFTAESHIGKSKLLQLRKSSV